MSEVDASLNFLKKLHNETLRLSTAVKFDKRDERDRIIVSLYISMIEHAGSVIILSEKLKEAGLSAIFRSMLEGYVDLKNLIKDPGYVDHLKAKYFEQWLKLMTEGRNKNNAFLAGLKDSKEFDSHYESNKKNLDELKAKGRPPLPIFEKFKKADLENVYRSYYNILCADTHNDIRALVDRHIEIQGEDFEVVGYREITLDDLEAILDSAAGSLMDATHAIHEYAESGCEGDLTSLQKELEAVRKKLTGND